jgi:hypothetical protein
MTQFDKFYNMLMEMPRVDPYNVPSALDSLSRETFQCKKLDWELKGYSVFSIENGEIDRYVVGDENSDKTVLSISIQKYSDYYVSNSMKRDKSYSDVFMSDMFQELLNRYYPHITSMNKHRLDAKNFWENLARNLIPQGYKFTKIQEIYENKKYKYVETTFQSFDQFQNEIDQNSVPDIRYRIYRK